MELYPLELTPKRDISDYKCQKPQDTLQLYNVGYADTNASVRPRTPNCSDCEPSFMKCQQHVNVTVDHTHQDLLQSISQKLWN